MLKWYYYNGVVNSLTTLDQELDKASKTVKIDSLGNNKNTSSIKLDMEKSSNDLDKVRSLEDLKKLIILNCDCTLKKLHIHVDAIPGSVMIDVEPDQVQLEKDTV